MVWTHKLCQELYFGIEIWRAENRHWEADFDACQCMNKWIIWYGSHQNLFPKKIVGVFYYNISITLSNFKPKSSFRVARALTPFCHPADEHKRENQNSAKIYMGIYLLTDGIRNISRLYDGREPDRCLASWVPHTANHPSPSFPLLQGHRLAALRTLPDNRGRTDL